MIIIIINNNNNKYDDDNNFVNFQVRQEWFFADCRSRMINKLINRGTPARAKRAWRNPIAKIDWYPTKEENLVMTQCTPARLYTQVHVSRN